MLLTTTPSERIGRCTRMRRSGGQFSGPSHHIKSEPWRTSSSLHPNLGFRYTQGPAATHLVVEPLDPIGDEAIAPFADRMGADAKPRRHDGVARLALARQHDLRPQCQCRRQRARPRYGQKMRTFVAGNRECRLRASGSHRVSPSIRIPETNARIMLRTYGTEH